MSDRKCPGCALDALLENEIEGSVVCGKCGLVIEESAETKETTFAAPSDLPTKTFQTHKRSRAETRIHRQDKRYKNILSRTRELRVHAQNIGLRGEQVENVVQMFDGITQSIHRITEKKITVISGACLYLICERNRFPVTIASIAAIFAIEPSEIAKQVAGIRSITKLERSAELNYKEYLESLLSLFVLEDEDKTQLLEICKLTCEKYEKNLGNYRQVSLACAAIVIAFLSQVSSRPFVTISSSQQKLEVSTGSGKSNKNLDRIILEHVCAPESQFSRLFKTIKSLLLQSAKSCPFAPLVYESNVFDHLSNILKY